MGNPRPNRRSGARRAAMQALYQLELAAGEPQSIEAEFMAERDMEGVDTGYFKKLFGGVVEHMDALDAQLELVLDRKISQIDPVERSILRIGVFELSRCSKVPVGVVINEAIELAKSFGGEQGHRYVNGVLDKVAKSLPVSSGSGE